MLKIQPVGLIATLFLLGQSSLFQVRTCHADPSSHLRVQVSSNAKEFLLGIAPVLSLTFRTPNGKESIRLTRREALLPLRAEGDLPHRTSRPRIQLLQGERRKRQHSPGHTARAAGHFYNDTLTVRFIGRRGNPFELIYPKGRILRGNGIARLRHRSRHLTVACGAEETQLSALTETSSFPLLSATTTRNNEEQERYLEIVTDADAEFFEKFRGDTAAVIQATLNEVEAIYLAEFGVRFDVRAQGFYTSKKTQPYREVNAERLLFSFRGHLSESRRLGDFDLAHLFTRKSLQPQGVVGLAFFGVVCATPSSAVGLSRQIDPAVDYIVLAHEIGHQLGAVHDFGDPQTGSTDPANRGHIMNATVKAQNQSFSDFSRAEIDDHLSRFGFCLAATPNVNIANGPGATPLYSLNVRARRTSSGLQEFRFRVLWAGEGNDCVATVYGTSRRRSLQALALANTRAVSRITSFPIVAGEEKVVRARVRTQPAKNSKSGFFITEITCSDTLGVRTEVKRTSLQSKAKRIFRKLSRKLPG